MKLESKCARLQYAFTSHVAQYSTGSGHFGEYSLCEPLGASRCANRSENDRAE